MRTGTTHSKTEKRSAALRRSKLFPTLRFKKFDEGWTKEKAGELCECIVPGRNKPTQFDGDIEWITTPDILHNSSIFNSKSGLRISKEEAKRVGSKIVPKNSVIISCVGDLGLVAIAGIELVINQQLHAFLPSKKVDYRFLMYSITTQERYMNRVATKTAIRFMNKNNCNSIPVYLPSLPEQQKIASFLGAVDEKKKQLTQKKVLLELYKKGIMQQLFSGKLRFKGKNGNPYPDWEEKRLGEVMKIPKKVKPIKFDVNKLITVKLHNKGLFKNERTESLKLGATTYFVRNKGQFIYGRQNLFNGAFGIIPEKFDGFYSSRDLPALDFIKEKVVPGFVLFYLSRKNYYDSLESLASGSGCKRVHETTFLELKINFSCLEEQQKIATYLLRIDAKISVLNNQIIQIQTFKKGLLQQLFV